MQDAESFVTSGTVDPDRLRALVHEIPVAAYARYPALSTDAVVSAIDDFVAGVETRGA